MTANITAPYYELDDNLPPFATKPYFFEELWDRKAAYEWMNENWTQSFYWVGAYLIVIAGLTKWMENKERYQMRNLLIGWNAFLAISSTIGSIRVLPEFLRILTLENGYYTSICDIKSLASPVTLFWAYVFVLSKVLELGDTVFLILRKRPLTFLHVFHHSTVLIACWYMPTQNAPAARWFGTINGFVHSIMYTYFTLQILGWYKIPRWISMCLTTMQITQMIAGFMVNMHAFQIRMSGQHCDHSNGATIVAMILGAAYFLLFSHFFYNSYIRKGKKPVQKKVQ